MLYVSGSGWVENGQIVAAYGRREGGQYPEVGVPGTGTGGCGVIAVRRLHHRAGIYGVHDHVVDIPGCDADDYAEVDDVDAEGMCHRSENWYGHHTDGHQTNSGV